MSRPSPGRHGDLGSSSSAESPFSQHDEASVAEEAADSSPNNEELFATDPLNVDGTKRNP